MKVVSRQWSVLSKSAVSAVFCIMLFAIRVSAQAQQPKKIAKIGYLATSSPEATAASVEAFRQALRANGWVEGQNVTIDYRYAEGNPDRLREYAVELVRSNVDVVLVNGLGAAGTAMEATKTIPIVVANAADPVAAGLVTSLARPGGNLTGVSNRVIELGGKRLEVLKETFPKLVRVAVLRSPGGLRLELKEMQAAAPSLKIQLQILEVRVADDFEKVFQAAVKARAGALAVNADPTGFFTSNRKLIVDLVQKKRLPAIYNSSSFVIAGGLMSYAADDDENYRRAAVYVDKILKGAKPAELPIERSTKVQFVINLKAAKEIGLTIPANVLARADKLIK